MAGLYKRFLSGIMAFCIITTFTDLTTTRAMAEVISDVIESPSSDDQKFDLPEVGDMSNFDSVLTPEEFQSDMPMSGNDLAGSELTTSEDDLLNDLMIIDEYGNLMDLYDNYIDADGNILQKVYFEGEIFGIIRDSTLFSLEGELIGYVEEDESIVDDEHNLIGLLSNNQLILEEPPVEMYSLEGDAAPLADGITLTGNETSLSSGIYYIPTDNATFTFNNDITVAGDVTIRPLPHYTWSDLRRNISVQFANVYLADSASLIFERYSNVEAPSFSDYWYIGADIPELHMNGLHGTVSLSDSASDEKSSVAIDNLYLAAYSSASDVNYNIDVTRVNALYNLQKEYTDVVTNDILLHFDFNYDGNKDDLIFAFQKSVDADIDILMGSSQFYEGFTNINNAGVTFADTVNGDITYKFRGDIFGNANMTFASTVTGNVNYQFSGYVYSVANGTSENPAVVLFNDTVVGGITSDIYINNKNTISLREVGLIFNKPVTGAVSSSIDVSDATNLSVQGINKPDLVDGDITFSIKADKFEGNHLGLTFTKPVNHTVSGHLHVIQAEDISRIGNDFKNKISAPVTSTIDVNIAKVIDNIGNNFYGEVSAPVTSDIDVFTADTVKNIGDTFNGHIDTVDVSSSIKLRTGNARNISTVFVNSGDTENTSVTIDLGTEIISRYDRSCRVTAEFVGSIGAAHTDVNLGYFPIYGSTEQRLYSQCMSFNIETISGTEDCEVNLYSGELFCDRVEGSFNLKGIDTNRHLVSYDPEKGRDTLTLIDKDGVSHDIEIQVYEKGSTVFASPISYIPIAHVNEITEPRDTSSYMGIYFNAAGEGELFNSKGVDVLLPTFFSIAYNETLKCDPGTRLYMMPFHDDTNFHSAHIDNYGTMELDQQIEAVWYGYPRDEDGHELKFAKGAHFVLDDDGNYVRDDDGNPIIECEYFNPYIYDSTGTTPHEFFACPAGVSCVIATSPFESVEKTQRYDLADFNTSVTYNGLDLKTSLLRQWIWHVHNADFYVTPPDIEGITFESADGSISHELINPGTYIMHVDFDDGEHTFEVNVVDPDPIAVTYQNPVGFSSSGVTFTAASADCVLIDNMPDTNDQIYLSDKGRSKGWYAVRGSKFFSKRLHISGNVHLILEDGCNLELPQGIEVFDEDSSLSIYGQGANSGQLKMLHDSSYDIFGSYYAALGATGHPNSRHSKPSEFEYGSVCLTINGGTIESDYDIGYAEKAIGDSSITINGGTLVARNILARTDTNLVSIEINGGVVETNGIFIEYKSYDSSTPIVDNSIIHIKNADVTTGDIYSQCKTDIDISFSNIVFTNNETIHTEEDGEDPIPCEKRIQTQASITINNEVISNAGVIGVNGSSSYNNLSDGRIIVSDSSIESTQIALLSGYINNFELLMDNSNIVALNESSGAAVGTGDNVDFVTCNISLADCNINASATNGAAIGLGANANFITSDAAVPAVLSINGGQITASSETGAGIGTGHAQNYGKIMMDINIAGSDVNAKSNFGAGIGSGGESSTRFNSSLNINISGGHVNANSNYGAGIGNGHFNNIVIKDPFLEDPTGRSLSHMAPTEGPGNPQPRQIAGTANGKTYFQLGVYRNPTNIQHIDVYKDPLNIVNGLSEYTFVADGLVDPTFVQDPSKPLSPLNFGQVFRTNTKVNIGNDSVIHAVSKNQEGIGIGNIDNIQIAETLNNRQIPVNVYEVHYLDKSGNELSLEQLRSITDITDIADLYLSEIQFGANPSDYGLDEMTMNLVDTSFKFTTVDNCNSIIYADSGKDKPGISDRSGIEYETQKHNEDGSLAVDGDGNPILETKRYAQATDDCKWSGVIFENGKGIVYQRKGKQLPLLEDIIIAKNEELQVPFDTVLNLNDKTITNNGNMMIIDTNSIVGAGVLSGNGTFWQRRLMSENLNVHDVEYSSFEFNKLNYMPNSIYTPAYGGIDLAAMYGRNYQYVDYFGKTAYDKEVIPVDITPSFIKGANFYPYMLVWTNVFKHDSFDKVLHANDNEHKYSTNFTYIEDDYIPGNFNTDADAEAGIVHTVINEFNVLQAKAVIIGTTLWTRKLSQGDLDLKLTTSNRSGIASNFPIAITEDSEGDKLVATVDNRPIVATGFDYSSRADLAYVRQYTSDSGGQMHPVSNGFSNMTVSSYYDGDRYLPTDYEAATKPVVILISDTKGKPIDIRKTYGDSDFDILNEAITANSSTGNTNLAELRNAIANVASLGSTVEYSIAGDAISYVSGIPGTSLHINHAGNSVLVVTITTGGTETVYLVTVTIDKKRYTASDFADVTLKDIIDVYGRKRNSTEGLEYTDSSGRIIGVDGVELPGKFVWATSYDSTALPVGVYNDISVNFVPDDSTNYYTITGFSVNITITTKDVEITGTTPVTLKIPYNYEALVASDPTKVQTYQLFATATGNGELLPLRYALAPDTDKTVLEVSETGLVSILRTGEADVKVTVNNDNYLAEPFTIHVKILVSTDLSDFRSVKIGTDSAEYGTTLNLITIISEGTLPIPGHFEWDMQGPGNDAVPSTVIPTVDDTTKYKVMFVPDDTDNYNVVHGFNVVVNITPAEDSLTIDSSKVTNITTTTSPIAISDLVVSENNLDLVASIKQSSSDGVINITDDGKIEFKKAGTVVIEFNHTSGNYKPYSENSVKSNVNTLKLTVKTHKYDIDDFGNVAEGLTASDVIYGDHLNNSVLAVDTSKVTLPVDGTFVWDEDVIITKTGKHAVKFVPNDKDVYSEVTGFTVTVNMVSRSLTTQAADYGTRLQDILISGDNPKAADGTAIQGKYVWDWSGHDGDYKPHVNESNISRSVKFVPDDTSLAEINGFECKFNINAISPSQADDVSERINVPENIIIPDPIELGTHLLDTDSGNPINLNLFNSITKPTVTNSSGNTRELAGHYEWVEDAPQTPITKDTTVTVKIKYVTDDTEDYTDIEDLVAQITITPHKISDANLGDISLTASSITVGQKYGDAIISSLGNKTPADNNGQPLAGTWEWVDKDTVTAHADISADGIEHGVIFVPDASTGYAPIGGFTCKLIVKRKLIPGAKPDGTVPIPSDPDDPEDPTVKTEAYKIQAALGSKLHYVDETLQDDRLYGLGTSRDNAITFVDENGEVVITGVYTWNDHSTRLKTSDSNSTSFVVTFTPDESTDYAPLILTCMTEVKPVDLNRDNLIIHTDTVTFEYGTLLGDVNAQPTGTVNLKNADGSKGTEIPGTFSWQYTETITSSTLLDVGEHTQLAVFTPDEDSDLGQKYEVLSDIEFVIVVNKKQYTKDDFDKASTEEPSDDDPGEPKVPGGKPEVPDDSTRPDGNTGDTIPSAGDKNSNGLEILPVTITYGTKLKATDSLDFKGKVPLVVNGTPLAGKFTWGKDVLNTIPTVSQSGTEFDVIYEPVDKEHYATVTGFKTVVNIVAGGITIEQEDITLAYGDSATIAPTITPGDINTFVTTYEVAESNKQYLEISGSGEITTRKITDSTGVPVIIKVTDTDGNFAESTKTINIVITKSDISDDMKDIFDKLMDKLTATDITSGETLGSSKISVNAEGVTGVLVDTVDSAKVTVTSGDTSITGLFTWDEDTDSVLKVADSGKSHRVKFVPEDINFSEIHGFGATVKVNSMGASDDEQAKIKDLLEGDGVIGTSTYPGKIGDQDLNPDTDDGITITLPEEISDKYVVEWKEGEEGTDKIPSDEDHTGTVVVTPKDPDHAPFELVVTIPFEKGTITIECPNSFDKHVNDDPFYIRATASNQLGQNVELEYSSADDSIAVVDKTTGKVTLAGVGTVIITVSPADKNYIGSKNIEVHVYSKASDSDDFVGLVLTADPDTIVYGTELSTVAIEHTGTLPTSGHFEWDYGAMNVDSHYKPSVADSSKPFKVMFVPDDDVHYDIVHGFSLNVTVTKKQYIKEDFDKASTEKPSDNPDNPGEPEIPGGRPEVPSGSTPVGGEYPDPDKPGDTIPNAGNKTENDLHLLEITIPYGTELKASNSLNFEGKVPFEVNDIPLAGKFTWSNTVLTSNSIPNVDDSGDFDVVFTPTDTDNYDIVSGFTVPVTVTPKTIELTASDKLVNVDAVNASMGVVSNVDTDKVPLNYEILTDDIDWLTIAPDGTITITMNDTDSFDESVDVNVRIYTNDSSNNYVNADTTVKLTVTPNTLDEDTRSKFEEFIKGLNGTPIVSGQTLADSTICIGNNVLHNGHVNEGEYGSPIAGTFAFSDTVTEWTVAKANALNNRFDVVFTPDNPHYARIPCVATVMVTAYDYSKDSSIISKLEQIAATLTASDVFCNETLGDSVLSWDMSLNLPVPGRFEWAEDVTQILRLADNNKSHAVRFVPTDSEYCCTAEFEARVKVLVKSDSFDKPVDVIPDKPLKDSPLDSLPKPEDGDGNDIPGHYEWKEPDKIVTPDDDMTIQDIIFIPEDPTLEPIDNTVIIHVIDISNLVPADLPIIDAKPGTKLSDIALVGLPLPTNILGKPVDGHYEWVKPELTVTTSSNYMESTVIFIPEDPMYKEFTDTIRLRIRTSGTNPSVPTHTLNFYDVEVGNIEEGGSLADVAITGYAVEFPTNKPVDGIFKFKNDDIRVFNDGTNHMYVVIFIPTGSTQEYFVGYYTVNVIPKAQLDDSSNTESNSSDTSSVDSGTTDSTSDESSVADSSDSTVDTSSSSENDDSLDAPIDEVSQIPTDSDVSISDSNVTSEPLETNPYTGQIAYSFFGIIALVAVILLCTRKHRS